MSITNIDGALAGMQPWRIYHKTLSGTLVAGRPHSLWYMAGNPGPGVADTSTAGGVVRTSSSTLVSGQIPHYDPGSGNSYLANFTCSATQAGMALLLDRLWDCGANSGGTQLPNTATTSTINSATWPARDVNGATTGVGVYVAIEVAGNLGAGTPTATLTYTNTTPTGSRSSTNIFAWVASSIQGAFYQMGLQAGDVGVQSIQSLQMSATQTTGNWVLVAYRPLAVMELVGAYVPNNLDLMSGGFPQIFNGSVPFIVFVPQTTTASYIYGCYAEDQG